MSKTSTQTPSNNPLRILGVDPGFERLGVSIIEKTSQGDILLFSDCIKTEKKLLHAKRLLEIGNALREVIELFKPQELGIEKLFFSNNQKTALLVAEARGVILFTAAQQGLTIFEYGPAEIKIAITGHGRSDKAHIMNMIPKLIHIQKEISSDDEYDAIAIAITHSVSRRSHIT